MNDGTGIWIDRKEALISTVKGSNQSLLRIDSQIEVGHVKGGSGSSTPYGTQDAVSESKYLEKKKHELKKYFDRVAKSLVDVKTLLLTGPAETKSELMEDLKLRHEFGNTEMYMRTVDKMTENQFKALVRDFLAVN